MSSQGPDTPRPDLPPTGPDLPVRPDNLPPDSLPDPLPDPRPIPADVGAESFAEAAENAKRSGAPSGEPDRDCAIPLIQHISAGHDVGLTGFEPATT